MIFGAISKQYCTPLITIKGSIFVLNKSQIDDEKKKTGARFNAEDKEKITGIYAEGIRWLDEHQSEEKEVYDEKFLKIN